MNISCLQENLSSALSQTRSCIGKESGLPILSTILIRAEGKLIYLHATNLETAIQCNVRGRVEEEGSIAIPAKTLSDFISLLPKEKIELKTEDTTLFITCGTYTTKIHGVSPEEFPLISFPNDGVIIFCQQTQLKNALMSVGSAAAQQETRPELHGVYMQWNNEKQELTCVGTDAYRLAEKKIPTSRGNGGTVQCIIPFRTTQELSRSILNDEEKECELRITETQWGLKTDTIECVSKLVQGVFPDYYSIIPQNFYTKAVLSKEEMVRAVKATSLFSRGGLNDIICRFQETGTPKGVITISSANTNVGENSVTLEAELSGGENCITVNYRYLLDGLSHIESDAVLVGVVDTQSPCVLRPIGNDCFTYLIMPIRE